MREGSTLKASDDRIPLCAVNTDTLATHSARTVLGWRIGSTAIGIQSMHRKANQHKEACKGRSEETRQGDC